MLLEYNIILCTKEINFRNFISLFTLTYQIAVERNSRTIVVIELTETKKSVFSFLSIYFTQLIHFHITSLSLESN